MWERIRAMNPWGFVCLAIAACMVYGSEWIIKHVLQVEGAKASSHRVALKIVGLGIGILGFLMLMDII